MPVPRSGAATRERIVDAAERLVFRHGFAATSIEKVIAGAGVTKGTFFYHFENKAELGRTLIRRFADRDLAHLEHVLARAERLSGDPVQQVLIFVGLLQEEMEGLSEPVEGCLFTSYIYEAAEYPDDVAEIAAATFAAWRDRVAGRIRLALGDDGVGDAEALAASLLALIEGGFVLAKAQRDNSVIPLLLERFRSELEIAFGVARAGR